MKKILMERLNCDEKTAKRLEEKLGAISDELKPLLREWLATGKESNQVEYNGYSIDSLMKKNGMRFTGALLTLDWLLRDPKKAASVIEKGIM